MPRKKDRLKHLLERHPPIEFHGKAISSTTNHDFQIIAACEEDPKPGIAVKRESHIIVAMVTGICTFKCVELNRVILDDTLNEPQNTWFVVMIEAEYDQELVLAVNEDMQYYFINDHPVQPYVALTQRSPRYSYIDMMVVKEAINSYLRAIC